MLAQLLSCLSVILGATSAPAAPPPDGNSWPQWRGPDRSGVVRGGPKLAEAWPADGPPLVWRSEDIPGGPDGGYGSPVVADGRVFLYVSRKSKAPTPAETLTSDLAICLDASNGKEIWRRGFPGKGNGSSTLCVRDGRVFGLGSAGEAFCLDAATGADVWRVKCRGGQSSIVVEQGRVVVFADVLTAFDVNTGATLWTQPSVKGRDNSAVVWRPPGAADAVAAGYLLCNSAPRREVACVELSTGKVLWTVPGGSPSTVAASGEHMAVLTEKGGDGLAAYRISPAGAQQLWRRPEIVDRGLSPIIHDRHVYAVTQDGAICVSIVDNKVAWQGKPGSTEISSPVLADGKLIALYGGRFLMMLRAAPDQEYKLLGKVRLAATRCTSPAIAGGKLYVRTDEGLACYDLVAQSQ